MLHFITFCSEVPAVSRHSFNCSRTISVWRSIGTGRISPVSGSNGGRPETNTMPPPRVTGETGAFHLARYEEIGSTRMTSRFMASTSARIHPTREIYHDKAQSCFDIDGNVIATTDRSSRSPLLRLADRHRRACREEIMRHQREAEPVGRHHGPVLHARDMVKTHRVPGDDVAV